MKAKRPNKIVVPSVVVPVRFLKKSGGCKNLEFQYDGGVVANGYLVSYHCCRHKVPTQVTML